ncbi:ABC transporter permease [Capillibacterium thermochitinicola]|uniref:ABC transporter permease subunit n=1 Tax=Capillibacterium thermochitinicola TaxID=2699427 RepID=A0A8J6LIV9_9FIRM|nr:ABC transporter permease subunit [Capillibacterium thermochitinicola]MBA2133096.1 ABC transporter permease subunit [Capillibacterium thermochitinicola]
MKVSIYKNKVITVGSLLTLFVVWSLAARWVGKEIILPNPVVTLNQLCRLLTSGGFWAHLSATLSRGLAGFGLSFLAGLFLGLLSGLHPGFQTFFHLWLTVIRSTPSMALILLALIWFESDAVTLFVTFLVVFPLITQNVTEGVRQVDPRLKEMARLYRVRFPTTLYRMYLPAILPYLATAAAAGLGLTWKVMIAAEVLAYPRWGIGARMDTARTYLQTPEVFAWTIVVIAISLFFDRILNALIRKRLLYWE